MCLYLLSPSVLEDLVQKHYSENKRIISLEGNLLRLAIDNKISRNEFIKFYIGNEINPNLKRFLDTNNVWKQFFSKNKDITVNLAQPFDEKRTGFLKTLSKNILSNKKAKNFPISNLEITSIDTPKFVESIPRPLSYEQMKKIINFFKQKNKTWISKRNISIIFLMWGLGMRINEVINLKKSDIQGSNWLIIKGKGNKERLLPIYDEIRNFILDMISETPFSIGDKNFIFVGEKGKKIHPTIIQKEVREVRKALDLPENTTPHSFRHTFATQLLDNMVDLRSIQELLGHDSLSSTQKYTNVNSKKIKRVIDIYHPRSSDDL